MATFTNKAKIQLLLMQALVERAPKEYPSDIFDVSSGDFTTRILSCLDAFAASCFNEAEEAWVTFPHFSDA